MIKTFRLYINLVISLCILMGSMTLSSCSNKHFITSKPNGANVSVFYREHYGNQGWSRYSKEAEYISTTPYDRGSNNNDRYYQVGYRGYESVKFILKGGSADDQNKHVVLKKIVKKKLKFSLSSTPKGVKISCKDKRRSYTELRQK